MIQAARLQARMTEQALSQSELARRVGVTQTTIRKLVSGSGYGSKFIHRIARELGTTPAFLSGETDDPEEDAPATPELSREEWLWVEYWRALPDERRPAIAQVVRYLTRDPDTVSTVHAPRPAYADQPR